MTPEDLVTALNGAKKELKGEVRCNTSERVRTFISGYMEFLARACLR